MKKTHVLILLPLMLLLAACGTPQDAGSWPGVSLNEDASVAYVAYGPHVYAVQTTNGAEAWRFPAESGAFNSYAPVQAGPDGNLLVSGYDHVFYSLDADTGSQQWAFNAGGNRYIGSALAVGQLVYAPNSDHKLYALDNRGNLQWSFTTGEPIWSQPASDGSTLYVASMDHMLYALDAQSGEQLWSLDLGGTTVSNPLLGPDGTLYVGTLAQSVAAVDTTRGQIAWTTDTEGWVWGEAALVDDLLVIGDLEGYLYALDAASGRQVWRGQTNGAITGAPTWFQDSLYVINEAGSLYAFSLDGRSRQLALPESYAGALYGTPVAAGELLLLGLNGNDSVLIALDSSGSVVWSFTPES
ncbi:MAG: PQQ-binding-like beta-propeller repeat protein [Anaerolineales bacterium]|nr:PQQ-binding-like beta-propeller repeat protein [Anaerolineales bacterium]